MSTPLPPVRRIVTGIDANGRSFIAEDGVSPAMLTLAARPDYRNNNIWRTVGSPAPLDAADSVLEQRGVLPPQGGTVIRVIDIPPEEKDPELRKRQTEAVFAAQFADAKHDSSHARHPGHARDGHDRLRDRLARRAGGDHGRRRNRDARGRYPDPARHQSRVGESLRRRRAHRVHSGGRPPLISGQARTYLWSAARSDARPCCRATHASACEPTESRRLRAPSRSTARSAARAGPRA